MFAATPHHGQTADVAVTRALVGFRSSSPVSCTPTMSMSWPATDLHQVYAPAFGIPTDRKRTHRWLEEPSP